MPRLKTESDFEAESDARTLMRATEIQKDPKRLARAQRALKQVEKEAEETLMNSKVAKKLKRLGQEG